MDLNLTKEQQIILIGFVASVIVGLLIFSWQNIFPVKTQEISVTNPQSDTPNTGAGSIVVHISGGVRRSGVYKLKIGDRVLDVINLAGGSLPAADLSAINLSEFIQDGQKIIIPIKSSSANKDNPTNANKININTADAKKLETLPGVGPSTALKIVSYRKTKGPFSKIEQLLDIPRFGKSRLEQIKDMVEF